MAVEDDMGDVVYGGRMQLKRWVYGLYSYSSLRL